MMLATLRRIVMKTLAFHELEHVYGGVGSCTAGSNRSCSSRSDSSRSSGCNSDSISSYCWAGNYRHRSRAGTSINANSSDAHSISVRGKADNLGNRSISGAYSYSSPRRGLEASFKVGLGYNGGSFKRSVSADFEVIKKF